MIGHPVRYRIAIALGCLFVLAALSGGYQLPANNAGAVVAPCPTAGNNAISDTARRVTVAVIDSGITPIAQLGRSIDWRLSRSFVVGESLSQNDIHGTEMASIIHRAAPSAHLLILKALDDQDGGSQAATAGAIRYAVTHRTRVINLSMAGAEPSNALRSAITDAEQHDDVVVVAAGNDGFDNDEYPVYPANYQEPDLISVAATDERGDLVANSDWGARTVTLGALGLNIATNTPSGSAMKVSGTSPAAALGIGRRGQPLLYRSDTHCQSSPPAADRHQPTITRTAWQDRQRRTAGPGADGDLRSALMWPAFPAPTAVEQGWAPGGNTAGRHESVPAGLGHGPSFIPAGGSKVFEGEDWGCLARIHRDAALSRAPRCGGLWHLERFLHGDHWRRAGRGPLSAATASIPRLERMAHASLGVQ